MIEQCQNCGAAVELPSGPLLGYDLRCPNCGKMVRKVGHVRKHRKINEADLEAAIIAAMKSPKARETYGNAPSGAKLYLALTYYGQHYKDDLDVKQYLGSLNELTATLSDTDINYLRMTETDPEMARYFDNLASFREPKAPPRQQAEPPCPDSSSHKANPTLVSIVAAFCVLSVSITAIVCATSRPKPNENDAQTTTAELNRTITTLNQRQRNLSERLDAANALILQQKDEIRKLNKEIQDLEDENDNLAKENDDFVRTYGKKPTTIPK